VIHLVLVEPEIHWNTGNLGRTALAVNAELHLVEPLGFELDDKHLLRAGLDYWPRVRLSRWKNWNEFSRALPSLGEAWYFSSRAKRVYWEANFSGDTVLIFGKESVGLPVEIVERAGDHALTIPMVDVELRSLNLSTAGALAAYEVVRQTLASQRF
jgi:tRNA (cytidine/uridine-2'-O-)-methyltransferase